jgi:uncharacterized membrane protein YfcA
MTPLLFTIITFVVSCVAGAVGSLVGIGGGIIVIPALTLALGVDMRHAIGASAVSVIATSSGAAARYVREHMSNLRVAMFLELGTTAGALVGAYLAGVIGGRWLFLIFAAVLVYSAVAMLSRGLADSGPPPPSALADRLQLHGAYFDQARGQRVEYRVGRPLVGLALMSVAGVTSGLLGIGSGGLKVSAMDLAMHMPIKASTATSNFMIGVTAAASAGVYFARGDIQPFIAAPVAAGVLLGATMGAQWLSRLESKLIRSVFVVVLLVIAAQMAIKGLR